VAQPARASFLTRITLVSAVFRKPYGRYLPGLIVFLDLSSYDRLSCDSLVGSECVIGSTDEYGPVAFFTYTSESPVTSRQPFFLRPLRTSIGFSTVRFFSPFSPDFFPQVLSSLKFFSAWFFSLFEDHSLALQSSDFPDAFFS